MTLSAIDDKDLNSPLHLVENTLFQVLDPELLRMNCSNIMITSILPMNCKPGRFLLYFLGEFRRWSKGKGRGGTVPTLPQLQLRKVIEHFGGI
jgi:hypothetical protein